MKTYFISFTLLYMGISGELYNLLENYLSGKLQRAVLNGQTPSWRPVLACVSQGLILGPLLFLVYINDLLDELKSNSKLFAGDTSFFAIVKDKNESANILNDDLQIISKWAFNWEILTRILVNLHKKSCFQEKTKSKIIQL